MLIDGYHEAQGEENLIFSKVNDSTTDPECREALRYLRTIETTCRILQEDIGDRLQRNQMRREGMKI